jgi:uncharacterized protein YaaN involved in tellurite resistance
VPVRFGTWPRAWQINPPAEAGAPSPEAARRVASLVDTFVEEVVAPDVDPDAYRRAMSDAGSLGEREIRATAAMTARFLERPAHAMIAVLDGASPVARRLAELRRIVEEINPARYELGSTRPRRLFGVIPLGDRLRDYFERYERAQGRIEAIVDALGEGRAGLERDSAAIAQEERSFALEMEALREYVYMAGQLDTALERRIGQIEPADPERAHALRRDVLFAVRRRRQDILTQLAIATQGHAALQIVQANNFEVIRAIDAATTATLSALRTAVMVAQALIGRRLVMERLRAVNTTMDAFAASPPPAAGEHAGIVQRATGAGVQLAALQRAWDDVFAALDGIDSRKDSALAAVREAARQLEAWQGGTSDPGQPVSRAGGPVP